MGICIKTTEHNIYILLYLDVRVVVGMVRSHEVICSRLSDRTAKKLGAAPIASNGLKPVQLDSREQICCECSIRCVNIAFLECNIFGFIIFDIKLSHLVHMP